MIPGDLASHFKIDRYGGFLLTDAIRPARHVPVMPREGFRLGTYRNEESRLEIPTIVAAVSKERLFDTFLALLRPLGNLVDVVLETSHDVAGPTHRDLLREEIDLPVAMSYFCDEEDLLVNDGCTGIAVIGGRIRAEVQFDEHKLLTIYADDLEPFEEVLRQAGIPRVDDLRVVTEGEHLHSTEPRHLVRFGSLCQRLGIEAEELAELR